MTTKSKLRAALPVLAGLALGLAAPSMATSKGAREVDRLTSLDLSAVLAQAETGGKEIFKRQCVACHGESGEGNGPAAVAFNPKPIDLTDANTTLDVGKSLGELTDDELAKILTDGKGSMPAFGALLSPDDIKSLVAYIRSLSDHP